MGIKVENVERYTMFCDKCGREFDDEMWHDEKDTLTYSAIESEWKEINGKWYCYDCYELNPDEDADEEYVVKS